MTHDIRRQGEDTPGFIQRERERGFYLLDSEGESDALKGIKQDVSVQSITSGLDNDHFHFLDLIRV